MVTAEIILPISSVLIGLFAGAIGARLGLIDHPLQAHKTHTTPTPLVGGLAVALPLITYLAIYLVSHPGAPTFVALDVAVTGAFLLGLADDRWGLSSFFRLLTGAALAVTAVLITPEVIVAHFDFTFLSAPIFLAPFAMAFSVLVIVGLMNAINMTDGTNGLTCGLGLIWVFFLLFYASPEVTPVLLLLGLCLLATLLFNLRGRLFLGDSGSYSIGMAISLLTILVYNSAGGTLPADAVVAWFILPVLDCLRLMVVRASQRLSPMTPDQGHFHHRLQRLMPTRYAVALYWLLVAIPGSLALALPAVTLPVILTVVAIYTWLLLRPERREDPKGEAVPVIHG